MSDENQNTGSIAAKPTLSVEKDVKFSFKKAADPLTGAKRNPVELKVPVPTMEGLVEFLSVADPAVAKKNQAFVLDLLADQIKEHARYQVVDDVKPVNKQEELDIGKLDLTYIANLPPSERLAGGIPKELWEAFGVKYNEVMPTATGKTAEQVGNAALLLTKKLLPCKTNKKALATLEDQLGMFWNAITDDDKEEFKDIYEFLNGKIETYLKTDEAQLIQNNL